MVGYRYVNKGAKRVMLKGTCPKCGSRSGLKERGFGHVHCARCRVPLSYRRS